jgi:hypothetical protein
MSHVVVDAYLRFTSDDASIFLLDPTAGSCYDPPHRDLVFVEEHM